MKYVVKEPPKSGHVVDADKLMREFNRAMATAYNEVDQNNVSSSAFQRDVIASPVSQPEVSSSVIGRVDTIDLPGFPPTTYVNPYCAQQASGVAQTLDAPTASEDGDYEERTENKFWQYVTTTGSRKLTLETISLSTATELTVIANGQILVADETAAVSDDGILRTSIYDIRILHNSSPLDSVCTVSVETNNGYVPFHASVRKVFTAGDHQFRVQIRDRSNGTAASQVEDTIICAYGFVR
jgi:hypothetical protein